MINTLRLITINGETLDIFVLYIEKAAVVRSQFYGHSFSTLAGIFLLERVNQLTNTQTRSAL